MKKLYVLLSITIVITIIVLGVLPNATAMYNGGVKLNNSVKMVQSNLDAMYKKQYNLVDNLTTIASEYAKFEKETLTDVVSARYHASSTNTQIPKDTIGKLLVTFENYPTLKTNEQYTKLSTQLIDIETEIQDIKGKYNESATAWNTYITIFPNNIYSKIFKWETYNLYSLPNEIERDSTPEIKL